MSVHEPDFFEGIALNAVALGAEFTEPDDDWAPMLFLQGHKDGQHGGAIMPLGPLMQDDNTKDMLVEFVIPQVIKEFHATAVVMVLSVWTAKEDKDNSTIGTEHYVPPSERPDRGEALMLIEYTPEGIGRYSSAEIIRHEDGPPTLGEWDDVDADGFSGRFVEPIVRAMKEAAK